MSTPSYIIIALLTLMCASCGKTSHLDEGEPSKNSDFASHSVAKTQPSEPLKSPKAYSSLNACVNDNNHPDACTVAQNIAEGEREKHAPRFNSKSECERHFSQCSGNATEGVYRPAIAGFMFGRASKKDRHNGTLGDSLYRTADGGISRLSVIDNAAKMEVVRAAGK